MSSREEGVLWGREGSTPTTHHTMAMLRPATPTASFAAVGQSCHIAAPSAVVVNTSGAGDTLVGGLIWAYLKHPHASVQQWMRAAMHGSKLTVQCNAAVATNLSAQALTSAMKV